MKHVKYLILSVALAVTATAQDKTNAPAPDAGTASIVPAVLPVPAVPSPAPPPTNAPSPAIALDGPPYGDATAPTFLPIPMGGDVTQEASLNTNNWINIYLHGNDLYQVELSVEEMKAITHCRDGFSITNAEPSIPLQRHWLEMRVMQAETKTNADGTVVLLRWH